MKAVMERKMAIWLVSSWVGRINQVKINNAAIMTRAMPRANLAGERNHNFVFTTTSI